MPHEGLIETVEMLSDRRTMRSIGRSMKQVERGRGCVTEKCLALLMIDDVSLEHLLWCKHFL